MVRPRSLPRAIALAGVFALSAHAQNQPPATPVVTEPQVGRIVNPTDVHMECTAFSYPNPGDTHRCTDWEIWTDAGGGTLGQRAWITSCIAGVERLHTHLGDGVFENAHAGRRGLFPESNYILRVRHRDSSNLPATEWGAYGTQQFTTGPASTVFPLELQDVLLSPVPTLKEPSGASVSIPAGATAASITLETADGELFLQIRGGLGGVNQITNPAAIAHHHIARLRVVAGSATLQIPETDLVFTEDSGEEVTVFIPSLTLAPGDSAYYWLSANGSTYVGQSSQTDPDFSTLARGAAVPWTVAPGFKVEIVATGFQMPVNIAFVPNPGPNPTSPLYYVMELYGQIKVVRRDGVVGTYASGLLNFNPTGNFPGSGEQGCAGLVVDPTNGDLYATMLYSSTPGVEAVPHYPAVEKFTSTDGGLTMATRTRILSMAPETQGQSHQISNISFGPDGFLYVHVGDGFDAATAQNLEQFRGKVLRINKNGTPVTTNPLYNASAITPRDYVYAYGYRNPFGGAWRISDNAHYIVENGPSVDRFSKLVVNRNMLWNGSDASMSNFAIYNWAPSTGPVNIAFAQAEVFGGSGFPADLLGRAYVTLSGSTWGVGPGNATSKSISEFRIDAAGALVGTPRSVARYNGSGASSTVAIAAGPDGLYFSDFYEESGQSPIARGSNVLRLRWVGLPPPPDCNGNTIDDAQDIAAGTSQDCNGNGIPDECDIVTGRSLDCNLNGVPDDCDVLIPTTYAFAANAAPFTLNGSAAWVTGAVRLTPATSSMLGTAIRGPLSADPTDHFTVSFDFRIGGGTGADGMSFAAFDASLYTLNAIFGEMGPGSTTNTAGGPGALVVGFDCFNNSGEGENVIRAFSNGVSVGSYVPSFDLEDNQYHRATVTLHDGELTVTVTNAAGVTETAFNQLVVPGFTPFVTRYGFGGRCGGSTNQHWIDNVTFFEVGPLDGNANGIPDSCECPADFNGVGGVTVQDIFDFLNAYFQNDLAADFNGVGGITVQDIFDYLDAYFTPCP